MNNYEFCVRWVLDQEKRADSRVLDYGCGAGAIVEALRGREVDAFGCDVFYEGGSYASQVDSKLTENQIIRPIDNDVIPFGNESFDLVINNQVLEHVEDLEAVLAEIARVLKPGGTVLSLFPDKGVWREGHCGIPFLHWFPKASRPRVYYAALLRAFGLGYHKGEKSAMQWSQDFCEWLDRWTHYRTQNEIDASFGRYFHDVARLEHHWLQSRLGGSKKSVAKCLPTPIQKLIVEKLAGVVFVARKAI